MRKLVACAALALLATGCGGEPQQANMQLYQAPAPGVQLVPVGSAYTDSLPVGPDGKKAMVRVNWTAGRDSANCLRIASLRVDRVGGDTGVDIRSVGHKSRGCGVKSGSADTTRYESAVVTVDYYARKGIQTFEFSGPVAVITGTGKMKS